MKKKESLVRNNFMISLLTTADAIKVTSPLQYSPMQTHVFTLEK